MATEAQTHANRRNSQKSTGPKTAEGKAIVAKNAVKHGLFAHEAVITGENQEDYELLREEILAELAPAGVMESILAERIVSLSWRLQRAERMQNLVIDSMIERDLNDPLAKLTEQLLPKSLRKPKSETISAHSETEMTLGKIVRKDCANSRALERLLMYERRIENSLFKTSKELDRRKLMRQLEIESAKNEAVEDEMSNHPHPFGMRLPHERDGSSLPQRKEAFAPSEEKDAKRTQSPAFGRKSEALNPKSETNSNVQNL